LPDFGSPCHRELVLTAHLQPQADNQLAGAPMVVFRRSSMC
jgi:hypothetical protein